MSKEILVSYIFLLEGLIELMNLLYVLGRFYKALILTKLAFDPLPLFNPYKWPLSIVRILTNPWLRFWRNFFPKVPIGRYGFDISGLIAFEIFEFVLKIISFLKLLFLAKLESTLQLLN